MSSHQVVCARGSLQTASWCWLTKMVAQWLTCTPFVIFSLYYIPEIVPALVLRLVIYSVLLATLATAAMLAGKVTAESDGVHYSFLDRPRRFIPWSEIEFRDPFLLSLEKPYTIARRATNEKIKIWPSMTGYKTLKECFAKHGILLEEHRVVAAQELEFRPFDEVLDEAFDSSSGR